MIFYLEKINQNLYDMGNCKKQWCKTLLFTFLLNSFFSFGQSEVDSLKNKTFDELYKDFNLNLNDTLVLKKIAEAYLFKGKKEKDTLNISKGYHYSFISNKNNYLGQSYLDSVIIVSKNKDYELYPLIAYNIKSRIFFKDHNYEKCLLYLFKARRS